MYVGGGLILRQVVKDVEGRGCIPRVVLGVEEPERVLNQVAIVDGS
jgi:hypothetical protein